MKILADMLGLVGFFLLVDLRVFVDLWWRMNKKIGDYGKVRHMSEMGWKATWEYKIKQPLAFVLLFLGSFISVMLDIVSR